MVSEENEFLGQGLSYDFGTEAAMDGRGFGIDGELRAVNIDVTGEPGTFRFEFSTLDMGVPLTEGTYLGAVDGLGQANPANTPRLTISGNGRECSWTQGEFTVKEVTAQLPENGDTVFNLISFSADFEQRCGQAEEVIKGSISFKSTVFTEEPEPGGGGQPEPVTPDVEVHIPTGFVLDSGSQGVASHTFNVTTNNGFAGEIHLSALSPDGIHVTFDPSIIKAPGNGKSTMTVQVDPLVAPGQHAIQLLMKSGGKTFYHTMWVGVFCDAPMILSRSEDQPKSMTVPAGEIVTLSVNPTGGSEPLFYQWYWGPSGNFKFPIDRATSSTYTTPPIQQVSQYWVRVMNACGDDYSWTATIVPEGKTAPKKTGRQRGASRGD